MYRLTTEQAAAIEKLCAIADESIAPHAASVDDDARFPREAMDALAAGGYYGLTIPEEYGGMGHGLRVACAAVDEIAQRCSSTAMIYLMHLCGCACYVAHPSNHESVLRRTANGEHLSTLAWSERGSRSHFWAPVSREARRNGRVQVDALKSFVTSAGIADGYVVSTGAAEGEGPLDTTLYLVMRNDDGVRVSGGWTGLGMRGNVSAPMELEAVELGPERALSEPGKGFPRMLEVLPWFNLGNAAVSIGIAEAATRATRDHLTGSRLEHQGSSLADLPNLRARLAQMRIDTDRGRAHLVAAIDAAESEAESANLLVLSAKASAAEVAVRVTDLAMKACGGAAFGRRLAVERHFRDARAPEIMAPTSDVLHDFIGRALCGMDLF